MSESSYLKMSDNEELLNEKLQENQLLLKSDKRKDTEVLKFQIKFNKLLLSLKKKTRFNKLLFMLEKKINFNKQLFMTIN